MRLFSLGAGKDKNALEELRGSERTGDAGSLENKIIDNALDFSGILAREVMVPRQDAVFLYADASFEANLTIVRESVYTRYPLCQGDKDHVIGVVHIRGIIDLLFLESDKRDLRQVMRGIVTIPEGMSVVDVFHTMQKKHLQMAAVADEYGGIAGIITVEDLMEEIVGNIQDEYDQEEEEIVANSDGSFEFDGLVLLDTVEELLHIQVPEHDEDTLGGYVFGILGRRPAPGDAIRKGGYDFTVKRVKGYRVERVQARKVPEVDTVDDN